jgi:tRNA dimethylallyltransferase
MTQEGEGRPVVLIAGPTASGKSAVARAIAKACDGVIVNADAMQVYRELRILTARPTPAEESEAPHRLYGTVSASTSFSVGQWLVAATSEIAAAWRSGRIPILVGGTGLYFRALERGLADVPSIPKDIRARVRNMMKENGPGALHDALARLSPGEAQRLSPADGQRLARALEVIEATGRPLADWHAQGAPLPLDGASVLRLFLLPGRGELIGRIDARFDAMIASGGLAEARDLAALGLDPALPAMKAIGIPELIAASRGMLSIDEAATIAKAATRQYAKRQVTWARSNMISWEWVREQHLERSEAHFFNFIRLKG